MTSILSTMRETKNVFRYFVVGPDGIRYPFHTDKVSKAFITGSSFRVTRGGLTNINNQKIKRNLDPQLSIEKIVQTLLFIDVLK